MAVDKKRRVASRDCHHSFPVVEKGKLVGIVTESDIAKFLINTLGIGREGSRITITGLKKTLGQFEVNVTKGR